MRTQAGLALLGAIAALGCSGNGPIPIPFDAGMDGGSTGSDGGTFTVTVLDSNAPGTTSLAIASFGSKVGVAYVVEVGSVGTGQVCNADAGCYPMPVCNSGAGCYEVRYVEPGSQPQKVATLHNGYDYGVSLAFTAAGAPVVGYLGGDSNNGDFWLESDMVLATPNGSGPWAVTRAAQDGLGKFAGTVVGLYSSIAVASGKVYAAYRDVHRGQFPNQDYEHSCLDFAEGQLGGGFTQNGASDCSDVQGGLSGFGGNNSLALGPGGEVAIASNTMPGGANDTAALLYFTHRKSGAGTFTPMKRVDATIGQNGSGIADAQRGPSLAWNSTAGYGIACEDRSTEQILYYFSSPDGDNWSKAPSNVYGSGKGGWWPSLAFDPGGAPNIAFYVCSTAATGACQAHELWIASQLPSSDWVHRTVDSEGGYLPRMTYAGGKAAIAYKSMNGTHNDAGNTLKLALEK